MNSAIKVCPACRALNDHAMKFCGDCGQVLNVGTTSIVGGRPTDKPVATTPAAKTPPGQVFSPVGATLIALLLVFVFVVWHESPSDSAPEYASSGSTSVRPRTALINAAYSVTGEGTASLTYTNSSGGTEQKTVRLPWSMTLNASPGTFLYLAAQKQFKYGAIRATLSANGSLVQQAEADSEYGIAQVSGRITN